MSITPKIYFLRNYTKLESEDFFNDVYSNNLVGYNFDENEEIQWKILEENNNYKEDKFQVAQFHKLNKTIKNEDVLIIIQYKGINSYKIGLIKAKSILQNHSKYKSFKYFELFNVKEFTKVNMTNYNIFNSTCPSSVTLREVNIRNDYFYSLYNSSHKCNEIESKTTEDIEIICWNWLKQKYNLKDENLIIDKIGSSNEAFDILYKDTQNKIVAAQVSYTNSLSLTKEKISKLIKLVNTDLYQIFTNTKPIININNVDIVDGKKIEHYNITTIFNELTSFSN